MKRLDKGTLLIILMAIIIFNGSMIYGINISDLDEIEKNANKLGYQQGIIKAYENKTKDKDIPYYEAWSSNANDIIREYKYVYDDFDERYESLIEIAYKEGFKIGYNEIIKDGKTTDKDKKEKQLDYAAIMGLTLGEIYGYRDFYNDNRSNWKKAIPLERSITEMYNLNREASEYRYDFLKTFKEKFEKGYNDGYRKANFESIKNSYEDGLKDGEYFGEILGIIHGAKDYFDNKSIDYKRNMPSDSNILRGYSLNNDKEEYGEGFLIGFKRKYEENYNKTFRTTNVNEHKWSYEKGYSIGRDTGLKNGEAKAVKDYYLNLNDDWKRHEPTQLEIAKEYDLILESERFREGFISGFYTGLSEGYTTSYQRLNKDVIENKTRVETVSISGGEVYSLDEKMFIKIEKGTYYNPVIVTMDVLSDNFSELERGLIKASDYYGINIANKSFEVNDETIELRFEYYGKQNGGIYKRVKDNWMYLPSEIEDGFIKTKVKASSFKEGDNVYCVLVDKDALILHDIRGHWAKDEINTFLRRGIVSGYSDKTFKPNKSMTKEEFLVMLSKVYSWQDTEDIQNIKNLKDFNGFKSHDKVIAHAEKMGYISGYSDKTFKPNSPITYKEVENIMKKVTETQKFYWSNYSSKILYEKDYRSKSLNSMNNNITRAEAVYMLYTLNEWRY